MQPQPDFDLLIVGGGVNGAGIARDAAGRGLRVLLLEQGDLAGATSSSSSKLIHGGLRYLENYEFRLVREALQERDVLLCIAGHIAWPMRFVLPHSRAQRPAWMIRLGLFLYDHLGGRQSLPRTKRLNLRRTPQGAPLQDRYRIGFEYSDCWVDDARLVILNAVDARERGADIRTRTRCVAARRGEHAWTAEVKDLRTGATSEVTARILVNAAGPWVGELLNVRAGLDSSKRPRLIKGSHLVLRRQYEGDQAYILQNDDRRIIFAIPYQQEFTLVGTTDEPFEGDPANVTISQREIDYLCRAVSTYFRKPVTQADIARTYSGVRPLYDDAAARAQEVTRDYVLDVEAEPGQAPVLSVFGGKITTYRRLAEHAMEKLQPLLPTPRPAAWTASAPLPGADLPGGFAPFLAGLRQAYPFLPAKTAWRLAHAYGTRAERILGAARSLADLGGDLGAGLTEAELAYLKREEWAETVDDVLWRRTKLGLFLSEPERQALLSRLEAAEPQHG